MFLINSQNVHTVYGYLWAYVIYATFAFIVSDRSTHFEPSRQHFSPHFGLSTRSSLNLLMHSRLCGWGFLFSINVWKVYRIPSISALLYFVDGYQSSFENLPLISIFFLLVILSLIACFFFLNYKNASLSFSLLSLEELCPSFLEHGIGCSSDSFSLVSMCSFSVSSSIFSDSFSIIYLWVFSVSVLVSWTSNSVLFFSM